MLRIQRVVIQGFKTFARKTEFIFAPGVTAIVGPNGSGKSNVADAVRWCLGEQSFGLLRSKKTADVIFSGSDKRARLGMATVSMVLDNSDGELPIDYSEVEITRRAYRDGENEYLINGQRVRLQDITQLLAPSGLGKRTYAVIGQGLIDRVLSLKPQERRVLFEEAAGITGYQQKRATALRRLEATQQNLERVQDIITELSPRLKYLQRQAERARERAQVEADLQGLLRTWYGYRWQRTLNELSEKRRQAQKCARTTQARRQGLREVSARIESLRAEQGRLRESLDRQHRIDGERRRQAETVGRRLAVARERQRQVRARSEEGEQELRDLRQEQDTLAARTGALRDEIENLRRTYAERKRAEDRLRARLSRRQAERRACAKRLQEARAEQRRLDERMADRRSRLAQLHERREHLQGEEAAQVEALTRAQAAVAEAEAALSAAEARRADHTADLERLEALITEAEEVLTQGQEMLEEAERRRQEADRQVDRLRTRLDLLERLRNEGAGYASGVRAVLQAGQEGTLRGVIGTVASQLHVPAHLDRAVEVALGGAFQNVITERWEDARQAIEYLKAGAGGRATFLPLDRLRVGEGIPAPEGADIVGNAAELVHYDARVAPALEQLLNRVWVATSLEAARRALDRHRGRRPTVVTLDGEIVRPGGAVTGGRDGRRRHDSILAREREVRTLPGQLAQAVAEAEEAAARGRARQQRIEQQQRALIALREQREACRRTVREQQEALEGARLRLAQAQQAAGWQAELLEQTRAALAALDPQEAEHRRHLDEWEAAHVRAEENVTAAEQAVSAAQSDELLRQLADRQAAAAEAREQLRSRQSLLENHRRTLDTLAGQIRSREQRLANLVREAETLRQEVAAASAEEQRLDGELAALRAEIEPAEAELKRLEQAQAEAEAEERHLQQLLRQDESAWNAAQLQRQRAEDRLENLRRDIRNDFGLAEMEVSDDLAYQPPLPFQALVAQLPVVDELPPGLDEEVRETRARLRRLSNVNPEAPREYEEAARRHDFLVSQSEDLEAAAQDLRRIIRELDRRMESELRRTFDAVAVEFVHFFRLLFRGGTARLSLTDAEDLINTGIEILARPPGKRPQSLDLLSGGERSLTACALIFAILRVSPTPFCILDEVDAALDEANVDRFREVLEGLGEQTQFILITHNRRTLEASDAIYGITMGDDGVSRVISLRLDGDEMVRGNGKRSDHRQQMQTGTGRSTLSAPSAQAF